MITLLNPWDLAAICGGYWYLDQVPYNNFRDIKINSLDIKSNELFVAINGKNRDGHNYVKNLRAPAAAIVEKPVTIARVPQLIVTSTTDALVKLAEAFIQETDALKIAITGSVGKTGTKEMLARCLRQFGPTHANQGNFNNYLGVPLTILSMSSPISYFVTEIGMNSKGEISPLSRLVQPNIAIITNVSEAHIGHMNSLEDVANEKASICAGMSSDGCIILPRDNDQYPILEKAAINANIKNIISFGKHPKSTIQFQSRCVEEIQGSPTQQVISFKIARKNYNFKIGMRSEHWAINALSVFAVCHFLGLDINVACDSLLFHTALEGRGSETKLFFQDYSTCLIDDAYNASPSSMKAALEDFGSRLETNKVLILTDMLELGQFSSEMHFSIVPDIILARPSSVILVGAAMKEIGESLKPYTKVYMYSSVGEVKSAIHSIIAYSDLILIKGSHGSGAHLLVEHLKSIQNREIANVI